MAICDNPKCRDHKEMPEGIDWREPYVNVIDWREPYVNVIDVDPASTVPCGNFAGTTMLVREIQRYAYANKSRDTYYHLCGACHTACEMLKGIK